jgi:predicted Zn-dependent protease
MRAILIVLIIAAAGSAQTPELSAEIARARQAEAARDFKTAEGIYSRIVAAHPNAQICERLGLVRHMQNEFQTAAQAFECALKLDNSLWTSHLFLGIDRYRLNQFAPAEDALSTASRLHPGEPEVMFWLGATQIAAKKYMDGFATLEALLERQPQHAEALRLLAESYASYGTALLERVAEQHPESAAGLTVRAQAREFDGDYVGALRDYRSALALAPGQAGLTHAIRRMEELVRSGRGSSAN